MKALTRGRQLVGAGSPVEFDDALLDVVEGGLGDETT